MFRVLYDTKKISFYTSINDKVSNDQRNTLFIKSSYLVATDVIQVKLRDV